MTTQKLANILLALTTDFLLLSIGFKVIGWIFQMLQGLMSFGKLSCSIVRLSVVFSMTDDNKVTEP